MERRINKKVDSYLSDFKENVKEKALELGTNDSTLHQLVQYIYDYDYSRTFKSTITIYLRL